MNDFPPIPPILLDRLEERFPLREDFGPKSSIEDLMHHFGQRSVIRFLREQQKLQNENILTNKD